VTNPYKSTFCDIDFGCFVINDDDAWPRWSPDGRSLIFERAIGDTEPPFPSREQTSHAYFRVNADGSGLAELSNTRNRRLFEPVAWSPDGQRFAVAIVPVSTSTSQIEVQNVDGTQSTTITHASTDAGEPAWSPDGSTIAFSTIASVGGREIHLINPDGSNARAITSARVGDCTLVFTGPNWSPDGRRLVATRTVLCPGIGNQSSDLVVMNQDGSGITAIAQLQCCDVHFAEPVWSPDGTRIVYEHSEVEATPACGGAFKCLIIMNADGSDQHEIHPNAGVFDYAPDWQPIPLGPQRNDYKNAAKFCEAERDFLGEPAFARKYSLKGNPANAFGRCVSRNH
jgi:Tol biopolymer transport system component